MIAPPERRARRRATAAGASSCRSTRCRSDGPVAGFGDLRELVLSGGRRAAAALVGTTPLYASFLTRPVRAEPVLAGQPPVLERPLHRPRRAARARALGRGPHGARGPRPGRPADGWSTTRGTAAARRVVLEALAAAAYGDDARRDGARGVRRRDARAWPTTPPSAPSAEPDAARGPPPARLRAVGRRAAARGGGRAPRTRRAPASTSTCRSACTARPTTSRASRSRSPWAIRAPARRRTMLRPRGQDWGSRRCTPWRRARRAIATRSPCLRHGLPARARAAHRPRRRAPPAVLDPARAVDATEGRLRALPGRGAVRHRARRGAPPRRAWWSARTSARCRRRSARRSSDHGMLRSYVLQFELDAEDDGPAPDPPAARASRASAPTTRRRSPPGGATARPTRRRRRRRPRGGSPSSAPGRHVSCSRAWRTCGTRLARRTFPERPAARTGGAAPVTTSPTLERLPVVAATFRALKEARP